MSDDPETSGLPDAPVPQDELLKLADQLFLALHTSDTAEAARLRDLILAEAVEKNSDIRLVDEKYWNLPSFAHTPWISRFTPSFEKADAADLYTKLCGEFGVELDEKSVEEMREKTKKAEEDIDAKVKDAEENLGETEVREALLQKAELFYSQADVERTKKAIAATEEKTVAAGQKIDLVFMLIRLGLFHMDLGLLREQLDKADRLFREGGDWERKNRLKVYQALFHLSARNFKKAADLFLESLSTFTATELITYERLVGYTILTSIISLERVTLKKKIIDAPEVLTVIGEIPKLGTFLNSLYNCKYQDFFEVFADVADYVLNDRYSTLHHRYFMREARVVAYSQFLASYKSVTLTAMANSFGVSSEFIDEELSKFISAGRIHCKIDKVSGVVSTNRPDAKNALYQDTIKKGDVLLNRIQKLSRVIVL